MKKSVLIFSALIVILASCKKKEYPDSVTETPAFYVSAKIDGQPVMLQAGTLGYYMYSSYSQDVDGMYSFIADVKPSNCGSACPNSVRIELNDNIQTLQGNNSNIASSIKVASYEYVNTNTVNPTLIGYMVSYKSDFNLPNANYNWVFGYGPNDTQANPTHTYATAGVYNTRLIASGTPSPPASGTGSIENPVKVTTSPIACRTRIVVSSINSNSVAFSHSTTGSGNYSFYWQFGDGGTSVDVTPTHLYPGVGSYSASLRVIDHTNSDTAYHNYWVNTDLSQDAAPNFYVNSVTEMYSNSPLAKIKVTYTDGSGKSYSSSRQPQTGGSNEFKILSVEEYKKNENDQPTKKLKIKFSCRLYSGTSFVDITDGEAVIAVAYK